MLKGSHLSEETKRKISAGRRGKYIGENNPFYGKSHSEETKRKMSEVRVGKRHSKETRLKMSEAQKGENNPNFGKHLSEEHKQTLIKSHKGKHHSEETRQKISEAQRGEKHHLFGKHQPKEARRKLSEAQKGEKNPNWQGGKSFAPYTVDWTETLKRSIRERDHYICQLCGELQNDRAFDVHHINYNKENLNPDNLITLCNKCHSKTNFNRQFWEKYFLNHRRL